MIVAHALTEATLDDATTGVELIAAVNDDIPRVTGDAAYDTVAFYDTASARGATIVVPPAKTARVSPRGPRSRVRDRTINTVKRIGRCRWKKTSRSQQQARVENAFVRYQSIIGEGLRAKTPRGRTAETLLACNILKPGFSISLWYRNPPDQFSRLDCAGSDVRTPRRRVTPSG